ncbi:MAG: GNAT family N-acetyltransferase, partial [Thermomicrobiales bacterium]
GSCGVIRKPLAETHVGVLGVSVTLEFRGHGIGGALIDAAISEATEHIDGLRIIELSVMGRTIRPANSTLHGVSSSMECCQAALRIEEGSSITCLCID